MQSDRKVPAQSMLGGVKFVLHFVLHSIVFIHKNNDIVKFFPIYNAVFMRVFGNSDKHCISQKSN